MNQGIIAQIIGPVLDIDFSAGMLPSILNAISIPRTNPDGSKQEDLICEVQQHLGDLCDGVRFEHRSVPLRCGGLAEVERAVPREGCHSRLPSCVIR